MLLILLGLYVLFALLIMFSQRRMIYYPTVLTSEAANQAATDRGFQPWPNTRGELIGWQIPDNELATAAVLVLHGNGGCALDRSYFTTPIRGAASVHVYVLEYPGYGNRDGAPSAKTILAAAEDALASIPRRGPIYIVSESLGAGAAGHLAGKYPGRVAGLAMFAPYDRLASVGQSQMPFLPVSLLLWDRFEPAAGLKHYSGPVKVVLADADTIIPARFGQRLYDGYAGPKLIERIPNAGHNDIAEQSPEWWKQVFAFWQTNRVPP